MSEIPCVCGRTLSLGEKTEGGFLRCPSCDAQHAIPGGSRRRTWALAVTGGVALGAALLTYWWVSRKPDTSTAPPPPQARTLYEEARELLQKGDSEGARLKLEKAVARDPRAFDARWALAGIYQSWGCHEQALPHLRQLSEWAPEDAKVLLAFGESLAALGERAEAARILEEVQKRSPSERAALAWGDVLADMDRLDDAIGVYLGLLQKNEAHLGAILRWSRAVLLRGRIAEVEERSRKLPEKIPAEDRAFAAAYLEVQVLREKGELARSLGRLDEALRPGKFWFEVARLKTQILLEMGRFADALKMADEVMKRSQAPERRSFFSDVGFLFVEAMLLRGERAEASTAARAVLQHLSGYNKYGVVASLRETIEALLLVVGRADSTAYLKFVEGLPRRGQNDHYLFLAILAKAEGKSDEFRKFLGLAREKTIGKNYPWFLIESLGKP